METANGAAGGADRSDPISGQGPGTQQGTPTPPTTQHRSQPAGAPGAAPDAATVRAEVQAGVATLTLHHPAKRNAMTPAMWAELPRLLAQLAADERVRVLVLTGAGATFCAGADIGSLREAPAAQQELATAAEQALAEFPTPTLAAVRGHCVGGGCQLAVACDLRFAAEDALLGVTPAKLGLVYPADSTARLARLLGPARTKYLLFSGELVDAEKALGYGLVDEMHPAAELDARVGEFAALLTRHSGLTQEAAKEYTAGADPQRRAYWRRQQEASPEAAEGVNAFLERRRPEFGWRR